MIHIFIYKSIYMVHDQKRDTLSLFVILWIGISTTSLYTSYTYLVMVLSVVF